MYTGRHIFDDGWLAALRISNYLECIVINLSTWMVLPKPYLVCEAMSPEEWARDTVSFISRWTTSLPHITVFALLQQCYARSGDGTLVFSRDSARLPWSDARRDSPDIQSGWEPFFDPLPRLRPSARIHPSVRINQVSGRFASPQISTLSYLIPGR